MTKAERDKLIERLNIALGANQLRAEFLAKAIFLISGGALTLSMGIFLGADAQWIPPESQWQLITAWFCLIGSMCLFILGIVLMICRDYCDGEYWKTSLRDNVPAKPRNYAKTDTCIATSGVVGLIAFCTAFILLANLSSQLLTTSNCLP